MTDTASLLDKVRARRNLPSPQHRRSIRTEAGLTVEEIAQALGVARSTVAHWETGRRNPGREHLTAYAELLHALQRETAA